MPVFHQTTAQLAFTLQQGLLLALREGIVWLPTLFFAYVFVPRFIEQLHQLSYRCYGY